MYISYDVLWKTLIDRQMSKTDLMRETGMSSRTLAKLSKNQNVTTETLLQICEALGCGISDVIEVHEGTRLVRFAEAFRESATLVSEDEYCKTYRLSYGEEVYLIRKTKRIATKKTVIHCCDGSVIWEQLQVIGYNRISEQYVIGKAEFAAPNERGLYLITGVPMCITGLDENGYVSAHGSVADEKDVYVMSQTAFKQFAPKAEGSTEPDPVV